MMNDIVKFQKRALMWLLVAFLYALLAVLALILVPVYLIFEQVAKLIIRIKSKEKL